MPIADRASQEPPPYTVLVHGPPGVGKTTLIKGLIKHYTRQDVREVKGPITLIAGKQRRLVFLECPQDLSAMIDAGAEGGREGCCCGGVQWLRCTTLTRCCCCCCRQQSTNRTSPTL